eukprot:m.27443 g.27443  ORF g.27443 m.27443 type:complete len:389 (+) comp8538_c0_seq1:3126-4292(+)
MLLSQPESKPVLASANAALASFVDVYGTTGSGNFRFDASDVTLTERMYPLLACGGLLPAVFAQFCRFVIAGAQFSSEVQGRLVNDISPQLRLLVWTATEPAVANVARHALLNSLEDAEFARTSSFEAWLESLGPRLKKPPKAVGFVLASEHVDLPHLLDLSVTDEDVRQTLLDPAFRKIPRGDILVLLADIRRIRADLQHSLDRRPELIRRAALLGEESPAEGSHDEGGHPQPSVVHVQREAGGPAPVFISYSWSNKARVTELRNELERNGLNCWMDESIMSGGQQLFEEIDAGVSESQLFIACVSDQYAKSENCRREIQLAADRKRLIMPVLVDELTVWPPRGSVGPLLAGRLYVNCADQATFQKNKQQFLTAVRRSMPAPRSTTSV